MCIRLAAGAVVGLSGVWRGARPEDDRMLWPECPGLASGHAKGRGMTDSNDEKPITPAAGVMQMARPEAVPGPDGMMLSIDDLPSPETRRWVVRRKAEVLAAINGGMISASEACARYRISPEELQIWQEAVDRAGVPGLRVTRIQLYRDDFDSIGVRGRRAAESAAMQEGWR